MGKPLRANKTGVLAAAAVIGLVALAAAALGRYAHRPLVIGYFENGWSAMYPDSFADFKRHAEVIDVVMPFWYSVAPDGQVIDRGARAEVVQFARGRGVAVEPLVNNLKSATPEENSRFLTDDAARARAVAAIARIVSDAHYDGVHLDFELLASTAAGDLTAFARDLRRQLPRGARLSVAVIPKAGVTADVQGVYDYGQLAGIADFLVLMAYDRHNEASGPGPVSPRDWVEQGIRDALSRGVPARRLALAAGLYGYVWPCPPGRESGYIPARSVYDLARRRNARIAWDSASQNPHLAYSDGGGSYEVWFQNAATLRQRLDLTRRYRLRGVALWRLGFGEAASWDVLGRYR